MQQQQHLYRYKNVMSGCESVEALKNVKFKTYLGLDITDMSIRRTLVMTKGDGEGRR